MRSTLKCEKIDLADLISARVQTLFHLGYLDTCVREACVQLEHEIKSRLGIGAHGDSLVKCLVEYMRDQNDLPESQIRTLRQELRSVFKLIRNEFMHNLSDIDETTALVVLVRIGRVRSILKLFND